MARCAVALLLLGVIFACSPASVHATGIVEFLVAQDSTTAQPTTTNETEYWHEKYEEEKGKVTDTMNTCISVMLLMSVGFMMGNFYLVNHHDVDFRAASWKAISSTISIFAAVLIFQAFNDVLEEYLFDSLTPSMQVVAGFVHMLFWIVVVQVALALNSGAICGLAESRLQKALQEADWTEAKEGEAVKRVKKELKNLKEGGVEHGAEDVEKKKKELKKKLEELQEPITNHTVKVKLNTCAWATLLGHMAGFATIAAFGKIQQLPVKSGKPLGITCAWGLLTAFMCMAFLFLVFQVMDRIREGTALLGDGEKDEWEELWDEGCEEVENDVMGLSVSWLVVQVLRGFIAGALPDEEGVDAEDATIGPWSWVLLYLLGVVAVVLSVTMSRICPKSSATADAAACCFSRLNLRQWSKDILSMAMAWLLLFGTSWLLKIHMSTQEEDSALISMGTAIVTTAFAFGIIFLADQLADLECTDAEFDDALRKLIDSLGILIGFGWERSFDSSVGGLAEQFHRSNALLTPVFIKLLLALVLALLVIPAWKQYILKIVFDMEQKEEEEEKEKEEKEEEEHHSHEGGHPPHGHSELSLQEISPERGGLSMPSNLNEPILGHR